MRITCLSDMYALSLMVIVVDLMSSPVLTTYIECNTSLVSAIDDSASNLFVIGDRRNRFAVDANELSYFCLMRRSWAEDIRTYIRLCLPKFTSQKLMIRKLGNQIKIQADKLCDPNKVNQAMLFAHTSCLNKVINIQISKWLAIYLS